MGLGCDLIDTQDTIVPLGDTAAGNGFEHEGSKRLPSPETRACSQSQCHAQEESQPPSSVGRDSGGRHFQRWKET